MISGKTRTGFEYTIDPVALNDFRILDLINKIQKEEKKGASPETYVFLVLDLVDRLLGEEQKELLMDHCDVDGRVPVDKINDEIIDIFTTPEIKKSGSSQT